MSDCKWTKNQQDAIMSRDGSIIVSAAAGSGKTAVLVERIIESLTDPQNPVDVSKLLVVTFTNAAAAEMRMRIGTKISELIQKDPTNINLKKQQLLIKDAKISTIHSFCGDLVRENFYKLGVLPNFEVADTNEMVILKKQAIDEVLEEKYTTNGKVFFSLVEAFSSGRDDSKLTDIVFLLYNFIRSHPFPEKWLSEKLKMYDTDMPLRETVFGGTLITHATETVTHCTRLCEDSIILLSEDPAFEKAYKPALDNDLLALNKILNVLKNGTWDEISAGIRLFKPSAAKRIVGYNEDPVKSKIMSNRDTVKSILKDLAHIFFLNENECKKDTNAIKPLVEELFSIVTAFSERLNQLKTSRNILDFGDLEHLALKLLVKQTENGVSKTDEALELCDKFCYVIVDECQDTNEAQDMIFRAVSKNEGNFFMVGDVKQSIYGFRQAMPEIFLRRKEKCGIYDRSLNNYPAKIVLDKNFRSRGNILENINFIFSQLMSKSMGGLAYTEEESLVPGATYFDNGCVDTELKIMDLSDYNGADIDIVEARYIAKTINEMVNDGYKVQDRNVTRPINYGDFCVLLRSTTRHAKIFADEMTFCGVPAFCDSTGGFLTTREISIIISLLKTINNPSDDISVTAVLLSPIFNFSVDFILQIRNKYKNIPIYSAFKKACSDGNGRCIGFVNTIKKYQLSAKVMSLVRFLNYLYEDTFFIHAVQAMEEGKVRLNNLFALTEYAKNFENSHNDGLGGFIKFIDTIAESDVDLPAPLLTQSNCNTVKIMSIHRSKGLEFPVCFLANCSRKFNKDKDDILISPDLGVGLKLFDSDRMCRYNTLQREAVKLSLNTSSMSEELRVLYVALTRAKEKLIMVTSLKNPQKKLNKLGMLVTGQNAVAPYNVKSAGSFSDWILLCALRHPDSGLLRTISSTLPGITLRTTCKLNTEIVTPNSVETTGYLEESVSNKIDESVIEVLKKRIKRDHLASCIDGIPEEISVTDFINKRHKGEYAFNKTPKFLYTEPSHAEKGTALHTVLQFLDFKEAINNLQGELDALVLNGFLRKDQLALINMQKLDRFLKSDLMGRILKSRKVLREYEFISKIKAFEYDKTVSEGLRDREILLRGTADCLFLEDGEYVLVDYKTTDIFDSENIDIYKDQLAVYKRSLEKCTDMKIKESILYSFYTGETVAL